MAKKLRSNKSGQVLIEYILMLALVVSIVTVMSTTLKSSLFKMWEFYGKMIAAPCPGCPAPSEVRIRK